MATLSILTDFELFLAVPTLTPLVGINDINAESVGQLLEKIAGLGLHVPITLIMDNARYQRCKYVLDIAARLNIEILFLPPYSPNLNLIERLWKFVRKECLYDKYYQHFSLFKEAGGLLLDCGW